MGSSFNKAIFEDHIQAKITGWAEKAKMNKGARKNAGSVGLSHVGNKETAPSPVPTTPPAQEPAIDQSRGIEIETINAPSNGTK